MSNQDAKRALAAIDKGHQLEGEQLTARDLNRARRILTGELSTEDARDEMKVALEEIIDRKRPHASVGDRRAVTDAARIRALVLHLTAVLGPTLVSTLAGAKDTRAASEWTDSGGPLPDERSVLRLMCAQDVWQNVSVAEGDDVARAWFVGANPWLGDDTPVSAIREGRIDEVAAAVKACLDDSFSG